MKGILVLCAILLMAGGIALYVNFTRSDHFGAPLAVARITPLAEALATGTDLSGDVRVQGKIVRQCPSAGCWFFLDDGAGRQVRVELGHLGTNFPQRVGRTAEVEGRLLKSGSDFELVGNGVIFH
jgi:hypothetical protein